MFHVPIPIPCAEAGRQEGRRTGRESHGCLGRPSPAATACPGDPSQPSPARFGSVRFSPCLSCRAAAVPSRCALRWSCQAQPPLPKQSKGPLRWKKKKKRYPSEADLSERVAWHTQYCRESSASQREREKGSALHYRVFGDDRKPESSRC